MTINDFYKKAKAELLKSSPPEQNDPNTAAFEARTLILHFLKSTPEEFMQKRSKPLSDEDEKILSKALDEKCSGRPLQYILGEWEFYGKRIFCGEGCLIPRPETEFLVQYAVSHIPKNGSFLDLCTGSGCIPTAILCERDDLSASAVDISLEALKYAEKNRRFYGLDDRFKLELADINKHTPNGKFDAILSNPPYIKSADIASLSHEVLREPIVALDGGADGLSFYKTIIARYSKHLSQNGFFAFEAGFETSLQVEALLQSCGFSTDIVYDYGGIARVIIGRVGGAI